MMKKYLAILLGFLLIGPALAADVSMSSVILVPRTAPATPTNGQCWTQSSGMYCRISGVTVGPFTSGGANPLTSGTTAVLAAPRQYFICTAACAVTPPVPAAGYEFCVMNDDNVTSKITLTAIGGGVSYENTARTLYGTPGTGTLVSTGAAADKICIVGRDPTHYLSVSFSGSWTAN